MTVNITTAFVQTLYLSKLQVFFHEVVSYYLIKLNFFITPKRSSKVSFSMYKSNLIKLKTL